MRKYLLFAHLCFAVFLLVFACKSEPEPLPLPPPEPPVVLPREEPSSFLVFERIEAESPDYLSLFFTLELKNPLPSVGRAIMESWQADINGKNVIAGLTLEYPENAGNDFFMNASASTFYTLKLNMDMPVLIAEGSAPADDYEVNLSVNLDCVFESELPAKVETSGLAIFPGVQAPVFRIIAIAILKAELVNTRFRVTLRIDNPNPYPVDLSSFSFDLFGNGRFWADGTERNIISVPAKYSVQGNLFLMMNFIDMSRTLLDQIINLDYVNYRFAGEAQVSTGVDYLPRFHTDFDLFGYSEVLEN